MGLELKEQKHWVKCWKFTLHSHGLVWKVEKKGREKENEEWRTNDRQSSWRWRQKDSEGSMGRSWWNSENVKHLRTYHKTTRQLSCFLQALWLETNSERSSVEDAPFLLLFHSSSLWCGVEVFTQFNVSLHFFSTLSKPVGLRSECRCVQLNDWRLWFEIKLSLIGNHVSSWWELKTNSVSICTRIPQLSRTLSKAISNTSCIMVHPQPRHTPFWWKHHFVFPLGWLLFFLQDSKTQNTRWRKTRHRFWLSHHSKTTVHCSTTTTCSQTLQEMLTKLTQFAVEQSENDASVGVGMLKETQF